MGCRLTGKSIIQQGPPAGQAYVERTFTACSPFHSAEVTAVAFSYNIESLPSFFPSVAISHYLLIFTFNFIGLVFFPANEKNAEKQANIDLLLTNIVMLGMNRIYLARKITSLHPSIRILFMSGQFINDLFRVTFLIRIMN